MRLMALLARADYKPCPHRELARRLDLNGRERRDLRALLRESEAHGKIVRLRKNRWTLPSADRQVEARIVILPGGSAIATLADPSGRAYFIPASALRGAIHGDRVQLEATGRHRHTPGERPTARVVRILARTHRRLAGLLLRSRRAWQVLPEHPRFPQSIQVAAFADGLEPVERHYVVVELESPAPGKRGDPDAPLRGVVVEDLGENDRPDFSTRLLLKHHELEEAFDAELEEAARLQPVAPRPQDLAGREDARDLQAITIDPADARDFDDAVTLRPAPCGWELGVHIADVSHFVPPGSAIDREAARRGNSVYLTGGFIPMLPRHLTSDVCSLNPDVDRLTLSVWFQLSPDAEVLRSRIAPTVIHSRARLDYDQVQRHFDEPARSAVPAGLHETLDRMRELAARLRARRMRGGAIDLVMPEVKCLLDPDGRVTQVQRRGAPEAYQLIEEFMLLANVAVAEQLARGCRPALYRIHEEPRPEQWARMKSDLAALAVEQPLKEKDDLNRICRRAAGRPAAYLVNLAILRNLNRAAYSDRNAGHFGLGFACYTHFTSPIRRYPDLLAHRLVKAAAAGQRSPYTHAELRQLADHCSRTERTADEAEEESLRVKCLEYYAARIEQGATGPYPALITGVNARGLMVELEESLQRALIPLHELGRDDFEVRAERGFVRGRRSRRMYRIGDPVRVDLVRVDKARRRMDVALAGGDAPGGAPRQRIR